MPDHLPQTLSVLIPARDEAGSIESTLRGLRKTLASLDYEIVVVDDGSRDATASLVLRFSDPHVRLIPNPGPHGYGLAVRAGLPACRGDAIVIVMADGSEDPADVLRYWAELRRGFDCVFGSRFLPGSRRYGYPLPKLLLNRLANSFIRRLFGLELNDVTNAFKAYHRDVIEALQPLVSPHFNLTVEMPLKAIVRGFSYSVIPISWANRRQGASKLRLSQMSFRYLSVVMWLWLERYSACSNVSSSPVAQGL